MYNFTKIKLIAINIVAILLSKGSSVISSVLSGITVWGKKPFTFLAKPFEVIGVLTTPLIWLLIIQFLLLLLPMLKNLFKKFRRVSHKSSDDDYVPRRYRSSDDDETELSSQNITNVNVSLSTADLQTKDVDSFE